MTVNEARKIFVSRLAQTYDRRELDAMWRIVMEQVMHYSAVDLVLREQHDLPDFFNTRLTDITDRLLRNEPLQYVLGTARFCGLSLRVTPDTLIPRPETEHLADLIVDRFGEQSDLRVLDVGTGSGCIAISLALRLRFADVRALDISEAALSVARDNARRYHARVQFFLADILCCGAPSTNDLDVLVSNPPYVTRSERAAMAPNVTDYEPAGALYVPDNDPLRYYKPIAAYAAAALAPNGCIFLECNTRYTNDVAHLLADNGLIDTQVLPDPFGRARYAIATQRG